MSPLVTLTMYSWPLFVVLLFGILEPRKAVTWAFAVGWCFLPVAEFSVSGLPDYTKLSATAYGIVAGTLIFHLNAVLNFRPHWADIPVAVWCVCPLLSSLANGLGVFDGQSALMGQSMTWGVPYIIGRIHFHKLSDVSDFVWPLVSCGVIYIPFCLYEIKMSPQLHAIVYGFMQHSFLQTARGGGWRPMVFMRHGLEVGMWMATATLFVVSWLLNARQRFARILGFEIPTWGLGLCLLATFVLIKSTGAMLLALLGMCTLLAARALNSVLPTYSIPAICILYILLRCTGIWDGSMLIEQASVLSQDRAASLQFRIDNEDMLSQKALQRPVLGWGGWGRARVYDEDGKDISVTDGAWIIALGNNGILGLISLYATLFLGPMLLLRICPPNRWESRPTLALAATLAVACLLVAADSLPNSHQIPVMTLAIGVCVGVVQGESRSASELDNSQEALDSDEPYSIAT